LKGAGIGIAREQLNGPPGIAQPSDSVDPGSENEDDLSSRNRAEFQSRCLDQSVNTGARIGVDQLNALFCQDSILTREPHDVGSCSERHEVEVLLQKVLFVCVCRRAERLVTRDGLNELEGNATTA